MNEMRQKVTEIIAHQLFAGDYYSLAGADKADTDKATDRILSLLPMKEDMGNVSDGYHTFNELYDHRCLLWINICLMTPDTSYLVEEHFEGWFLLGNETFCGQISYHCPNKYLPLVKTIKRKIIKYDGHTPSVVIERLTQLAQSMYLPMKEKVKKCDSKDFPKCREALAKAERYEGALRLLKYRWDSLGEKCLSTSSYQIVIQALGGK